MASNVGGAGLWAMTTAISGPPQMIGFLRSRELGSPRQRSERDGEHRGKKGGKERGVREEGEKW